MDKMLKQIEEAEIQIIDFQQNGSYNREQGELIVKYLYELIILKNNIIKNHEKLSNNPLMVFKIKNAVSNMIKMTNAMKFLTISNTNVKGDTTCKKNCMMN